MPIPDQLLDLLQRQQEDEYNDRFDIDGSMYSIVFYNPANDMVLRDCICIGNNPWIPREPFEGFLARRSTTQLRADCQSLAVGSTGRMELLLWRLRQWGRRLKPVRNSGLLWSSVGSPDWHHPSGVRGADHPVLLAPTPEPRFPLPARPTQRILRPRGRGILKGRTRSEERASQGKP